MATNETSPAKHCKTCKSEIVETINDSNFHEGECGPCEYRRYSTHARLLVACKGVLNMVYRDKNANEHVDLDQYEKAEWECNSAINDYEDAA